MLSPVELAHLQELKQALVDGQEKLEVRHEALEAITKALDRACFSLSREKDRTKHLGFLVAELYGRLEKQTSF